MKKILGLMIVSLFIFTTIGFAKSPAKLNREKRIVKRLVNNSIRYWKKHGEAKALKMISTKNGMFMRGDIYVFASTFGAKIIAHPISRALVGRTLINIKDVDGTHFMQKLRDKAKAGGGWVDYKWVNPKSKKIQMKTTFVKRVPGTKNWVGCGVYK